jgi:hypothetical protein
MSTTDLVKSVSIDNLVNQRGAVLAKLVQGLQMLKDAAALAGAAHVGFPEIGMNCMGGRDFDQRITGSYAHSQAKLIEQATKAIDASAWAYLMNESGLRTFMDAAARNEWDNKVRALEVPPLTVENITATFTAMHDSRGDLFERGVLNCFRALSWDYKTNQPFKFGKRLILTYLLRVNAGPGFRYLSMNHKSGNQLDDLDRVLHILDGQPEPDHRNGWDSKIKTNNKPGEFTGTYFKVRWFLNGNGHLTFSRPDLVEKMNQILAKHHPNALASEVR